MRRDVHICPYNWDLPIHPPLGKERERLHCQVHSFHRHFKTFRRSNDVHRQIQADFVEKPWVQKLVCARAAQVVGQQLAVKIDKDAKRRIIMDHAGYVYRLLKGFLADKEHYEHMEGMTKQEMANIRNRLARTHLPSRICKQDLFNETNCQYAYHNYKAKCIGMCKAENSHAESPLDGSSAAIRVAPFGSAIKSPRGVKQNT